MNLNNSKTRKIISAVIIILLVISMILPMMLGVLQ